MILSESTDILEADGEVESESNEPLAPRYASPHFRWAEFACNHCGELLEQGIHPKLIEVLEAVREHFGKPTVINSGYRCPVHNKNVGGARYSQHLYGRAADISVSGVAPFVVHEWLSRYRGNLGGLGHYATFTHVDVGPNGRRWRG